MAKVRIRNVSLDALNEYENNPRKHSPEQIAAIVQSIREFGFLSPVVADKDGSIVAGHARVEAAREAGLTEVPVVDASHLTPEQKRLYVIIDNRIAEMSDWDVGLLNQELKGLLEADLDIDFEVFGIDDEFLGITGSFEPNLSPEAGYSPVTGEDVREAEKSVTDGYRENQPVMIQIVCPHCAEEFMVRKDELA